MSNMLVGLLPLVPKASCGLRSCMYFLLLAFLVVMLIFGAAVRVEKRYCVSIRPGLLLAERRSRADALLWILGRTLLPGVFMLLCFSSMMSSLAGSGLYRSTSAGSITPFSVSKTLSLSIGIMLVMLFGGC